MAVSGQSSNMNMVMGAILGTAGDDDSVGEGGNVTPPVSCD